MSITRIENLIVGTGFAGLGMAIRLAQAGRRDFALIERAGEVGGTWRDNTYPGCTCDVPSSLYSLSFAPNPDWSCTHPQQPEILRYLCDCADRFGIRPHIRFGAELTGARWDEAAARWLVETTAGTYDARFLILGTGGLSSPRMPEIAGLDTFRGTLFHAGAWRHDHDLGGERVAVIGTGASAIQFVPQVQRLAASLSVFQRTPAWVLPNPGRRLLQAERWLSRRVPATQSARRLGSYVNHELLVLGFAFDPRFNAALEVAGRELLRLQVRDRALRARLTPRYRLGCKRVLISNDFYPALTRTNVELVTDAITEVREHDIVTAGGRRHAVDTIIAGTGYHTSDVPVAHRITGRGETLAARWGGSPQAYLGTSVAGFPNMFQLFGPNTAVGHTSVVYMIEAQIEYVLKALQLAQRERLQRIEVRPEVQAAYNAALQERSRGTVWTSGGCSSYYLDVRGNNFAIWPTFTLPFQRRTRRFDVAAYTLQRDVEVAA